MAAATKKKNSRVTLGKKDSGADSIMPMLRKFIWFAGIAALAWYSTSVWGVQMRQQLGQWFDALLALIAN